MASDDSDWADIPLFAPDSFVVPKISPDDDDDSVPSSLAALSHLLYDEETPQEQAELLRDKGNMAFKRGSRQIKEAVRLYTQAIDVGCEDPEVAAANYSNRAAAHLKLANYRYVLEDVDKSLSYQPTNPKACYRAAMACNALHKYAKGVRYCQVGLAAVDASATPIAAMRPPLQLELRKAQEGLAKEDAHRRASEDAKKERYRGEVALHEAFQLRKIVVGSPLFAAQRKNEPRQPVLDEQGSLVWPVLFVYPDLESRGTNDFAGNTDFVSDFHEDSTLGDQLELMFPDHGPPVPWDTNHLYRASNLQVLYRRRWTFTAEDLSDGETLGDRLGSTQGPTDVGKWVTVQQSTMLGEVLMRPDYVVPQFPVFYVCPSGFTPK